MSIHSERDNIERERLERERDDTTKVAEPGNEISNRQTTDHGSVKPCDARVYLAPLYPNSICIAA